jgi:tetratricopeptide (TPR) repeat protein
MGEASRAKRRRAEAPATPIAAGPDVPREAGPKETRRFEGFLPGVLAAAALFRILYFLTYQAHSVHFDSLFLDARIYDDWARRIAGGEWIASEPFYFAPGYPYLLALLYRFVSPWVGTVYIFQFLLGLVNIFLIHRLAGDAFGRRAARAAAVLATLYASFPFLEAKMMSATAGLTTLLLALVLLVSAAGRSSPWRWLLGGLLMGFTSLIRPESLLAAPLFSIWIWRWGRPPHPSLAGWRGWRPTLAAGLLLGTGWIGGVLPSAAHNIAAGGSNLISSQAGITFYQSNNPRARGLYVALNQEGFSGTPARQAEEERRIAEEAVGRPLSRSEVSSYWFGRGLEFVLDQPGRFLWLLGMKALRFAGSYEYSTEYILYVERETIGLLRVPFAPFALLLALAIPTLAAPLRRGKRRRPGRAQQLNPASWLLIMSLLSTLGACIAFHVSSRYRLPATVPLIVFGAATLVGATDAWQRGRRSEVYVTAAIVGVVFLFAHFEKDSSATVQEANVHYNTGNLWANRDEHVKAVAEYRRALEMGNSRSATWFNMGNSLRKLGELEEAAEAYGEALSRRKRFFAAWFNRGFVLMELEDWQGAREAYARAADLAPGNFAVHLALGRSAARLGDREAAIRHLDRALEIRPDSREALRERAGL